tara:strand:- start:595 stop:912 length:318 start_codon:yes stop_codon:yes gene_type:complete
MPYTIRQMIKAWDEAYGEDLREEEGFLNILKQRYGSRRSTGSRSQRRTTDPGGRTLTYRNVGQPKRKLSAWNKFVKANSKKKIYQYASGKLKLKKMGIAYRKKKR